MLTTEQPKWKHDCERCRFLGRYEHMGDTYDLYSCTDATRGPTLIARWSSEPSLYMSSMAVAKSCAESTSDYAFKHPLAEALRRYREGG